MPPRPTPHDRRTRPAASVRQARERPSRQPRPSRPAPAAGTSIALALMAGWAGLLAWAVWTQRLPPWSLAGAAALNALAFAAYAFDKSAARSGGWRISERQLHTLALLGGWPAAWWAQQWLRHKSRKQPFRAIYWATAVLHCMALAAALFWLPAGALRFS